MRFLFPLTLLLACKPSPDQGDLESDCYDCQDCGTQNIVVGDIVHEVPIEYAGCPTVCSYGQRIELVAPPCDGTLYLHCGEIWLETDSGISIEDPDGSYPVYYDAGSWYVDCPAECDLYGDENGRDSSYSCPSPQG